MRPSLCLVLAGLACLAACEVTVDNTPPPQPPAQTAPRTQLQGPSSPPSNHPAPSTPPPTQPQSGSGAAVATPEGVEAGCYNKCLEQNMMKATAPKQIAAQCQASCSIADKCVETHSEPDCQRCCRGNRSRGASFEADRCRCI